MRSKTANKTRLGRTVVFTLLALLSLLCGPSGAASRPGGRVLSLPVRWVIDGDTIVLRGGIKVRYVGIDTPEVGEAFYEEAKERNRRLVGRKVVRVVVCGAQARDVYGRLLGSVYVDGLDVGAVLLREGLARTLIIPPCGLAHAKEYRGYERDARRLGLGIWGTKGSKGR